MKRQDLKPGDVFVYLEPGRPALDEKASKGYFPVTGKLLFVDDGNPPRIAGATPSPVPGHVLGKCHNERAVMVIWASDQKGDCQ